MKRQLNVAIVAILAAKTAISRLKQRLASDDPRSEVLDDAEIGTAWIIKRLQAIEVDAASAETADVPACFEWDDERDRSSALCQTERQASPGTCGTPGIFKMDDLCG